MTSPPQQIRVTTVVEVTAAPPKGPKTLRLNFGPGDVNGTIDPALSTNLWSIQIVDETTVGLTRQNEETAAIEPGMAEKWDVSADGKVYTFHILKGVPWVRYNAASQAVETVKDEDGKERMVTAKDFEYGILRTLDPKTASGYAYVLTTIIAGAAEYNSGTITDTAQVGVRALDDYTLEVTINEPASFAPNILGMWVAHAQPRWLIEERGDRWTETGFFQGYGPYTLRSWNHDSDITLIRNPFWTGANSIPQAKIEEITWTMLAESPAFANYEAGTLDVVNVPLSEIDRVKADPALSKELKIAPILCTSYYGFNVTKPPFDNPKVRLAFSLAIDRQALIDNVTKGGEEPAQWFARPGLTAAPTLKTHPDLGIKYNPEEAKELLAEVYPDISKVPPITLMSFPGESDAKVAEAILAMWKATLGVDVQHTAQEGQVYIATLQTDPPQIYAYGWCQDYPDANNFDREVFYSRSLQNFTNWKNEEYDTLVDDAARETDEAKRRELYAKAEEILVRTDAAIAPITWATAVTVAKPYVQRTYSVTGIDHYEKWDINR